MSSRLVAGLATALTATAVVVTAPGIAVADDGGGMAFTPIAGSAYDLPLDPGAPFLIPAGYRQYEVSTEFHLDLYPGRPDVPDMNTVNETGRHAGRYLYRTMEVRGANNQSNGAVTVVDLETGATEVLAQRIDWDALDGIRWTPWGTLLFAEEVGDGKLYELELDRRDPSTAVSVTEHPALGVMAHEGIDYDRQGNLYVIDEFRGGAIYKFVPDRRGDLSSGDLYALAVADGGTGLDVGQGTWVRLDRAAVATNARAAVAAANAAGAGISTFQRPEDVEVIGGVLYVAITEAEPQEQAAGAAADDGRVVAVDLRTTRVTNFVKGGVNVPAERTNVAPKITGLANPDNVAEGPDGRLWIVEDNDYSDIWVADRDRNRDGAADTVDLFASLTDRPAEGTGIYFGTDPDTLFVNIQHSGTGMDRTMAITKRDVDEEFAAIGDTPYGAAAKANFGALVTSINARVDEAVHVGDIKSGGSACSNEYFAEIKALFDTFRSLVYTPGDNEWTDCHRVTAGRYDPLERLDAIRSTFFAAPGMTLGTEPEDLDVQDGFPENVRWEDDELVLAAMHLTGSNNSMLPWTGIADDPDRRIAEADARLAAAISWLDETFAEAQDDHATAVVLFHQADLWDAFGAVDAMTPFVQRLAEHAAGFDGDILLVEGDSHSYLVDRPLAEPAKMARHGVTTPLPNVIRVVVPGDVQAQTRWLKIGFDGDQVHPFTFERVAF